MAMPFERNLSAGLIPFALAQESGEDRMSGKSGLTLLSDRPLNAETPAHLLDDDITPSEHMFVRLNGLVPETALAQDATGWKLVIDGEVDTPLELSVEDLKSRFENVTRRLVVECGGNGRAYYHPGASGNQCSTGAVGCPEWTGVRLADVLKAAGVKSTAVYTGPYGNDVHLSGDDEKDAISRGVPIEKTLEEDRIIAWTMNGQPIPALHGFPLRLVIPGYPGSVSQKYLTRIRVRDHVHDGAKMSGYSYRPPAYQVAPGTEVPEADRVVLTVMPVKSLIIFPKTGVSVPADQSSEVRGHAWACLAALARQRDPARGGVLRDLGAGDRYEWGHAASGIAGLEPRGCANNIQHRIVLVAG